MRSPAALPGRNVTVAASSPAYAAASTAAWLAASTTSSTARSAGPCSQRVSANAPAHHRDTTNPSPTASPANSRRPPGVSPRYAGRSTRPTYHRAGSHASAARPSSAQNQSCRVGGLTK